MKCFYSADEDAYVHEGKPFVLDGVSYPANFLTTATQEELARLGLIEVTVTGARKDERYYINTETLSNGVKTIIASPRPDVVNLKWEDIKAERDRRTENGGYKVGDKWFHSDQKSRAQQLGLVLLGANIPTGLLWKTMDGSFVPMIQPLAQQILESAAASDQAIFASAEVHKAAMETSAEPAEYDFSGGWPPVFGDQP